MSAQQQPIFSDNTISKTLVDSDLARLAIVLHQASAFRFWLVAHELSRRSGGAGWCEIESLWLAIGDLPATHYTRRHFRRVLAAGDGLFWQMTDDRLYLAGVKKLAADLVLECMVQQHTLAVEYNLPGSRNRVEIELGGSIEAFEARIYHGWILANPRETFSRETLSGLFGRGDDTLRRWESKHLRDSLAVIENYAIMQQPGVDSAPDAHYDRKIGAVVYQIPNSYRASGFQTGIKGQKRKIAQSVGGIALGGDAKHTKRYFAGFKTMQRVIRRHSGSSGRYLLGPTRRNSQYWHRGADIFTTL